MNIFKLLATYRLIDKLRKYVNDQERARELIDEMDEDEEDEIDEIIWGMAEEEDEEE